MAKKIKTTHQNGVEKLQAYKLDTNGEPYRRLKRAENLATHAQLALHQSMANPKTTKAERERLDNENESTAALYSQTVRELDCL